MVLNIALGIVALITLVRVVKTVKFNLKVTKGLEKSDRRKLMWRYGPFIIDDYVVSKHLRPTNDKPSIPIDIIKTPKQAA